MGWWRRELDGKESLELGYCYVELHWNSKEEGQSFSPPEGTLKLNPFNSTLFDPILKFFYLCE